MHTTEKLNAIINKQYISEITKLKIDITPNPKLEQEQVLLVMISKITDNETANKARDLYHSQYHVYDFDKYLSLLLELYNLLKSGVSENDAFQLINLGCSSSYHGFKTMLDL